MVKMQCAKVMGPVAFFYFFVDLQQRSDSGLLLRMSVNTLNKMTYEKKKNTKSQCTVQSIKVAVPMKC